MSYGGTLPKYRDNTENNVGRKLSTNPSDRAYYEGKYQEIKEAKERR